MPTSKIMSVTPKLAGEWLAKNTHNRNIRSAVVAQYARDMAQGRWQFTGEAIKFDTDGNLLDGQHRLLAIVRADVAVSLLVIHGVAATSQEVMDSGTKRQASDALALRGHANTALLASVARFAILLDASDDFGKSVTHSEVIKWVEANPDLQMAARATNAIQGFVDLAPTALCYSRLVLARSNAEAAEQFFDAIANNITTGQGDPINTLIRRVSTARRNGERLRTDEQVQFIIRAWNAWRSGATLHVLRTHSSDGKGGATRVSIPKVAA